MDQKGCFDLKGNYFAFPNGYTDFMEIMYSMLGLIIIVSLVLYSLFIVFLVFLVSRLFEHRRLRLSQKRLKLEQKIMIDLNKKSKVPGVYLFDGTFVPRCEYEGCCVECLLLTKQLVAPGVCEEMEIHKTNCSTITDYKLQNNATYI